MNKDPKVTEEEVEEQHVSRIACLTRDPECTQVDNGVKGREPPHHNYKWRFGQINLYLYYKLKLLYPK